MDTTQTSLKKEKIKLDFKDSKYATGRRKTETKDKKKESQAEPKVANK